MAPLCSTWVGPAYFQLGAINPGEGRMACGPHPVCSVEPRSVRSLKWAVPRLRPMVVAEIRLRLTNQRSEIGDRGSKRRIGMELRERRGAAAAQP